MDIATVAVAMTAMKQSMDLLSKVSELAKGTKSTELKKTIAELANKLADANLAMADLKMKLIQLNEENEALKQKRNEPKPKAVFGCYHFEGDENLYCPGCYAKSGMKALTTRLNTHQRKCSVCQAILGS